ncbi:hypothetical protein H640_05631 [Cutibacterium granulosum TM11]|uniref:Uncharacterized protein n=1 Tax=Cutibacterium granulosum TM11 TaxID=1292373 RepID=A0ACB4UND8_9ACTN|nr:hypothetical protein H640_05631 [Cutibacterium granulosum TM11]
MTSGIVRGDGLRLERAAQVLETDSEELGLMNLTDCLSARDVGSASRYVYLSSKVGLIPASAGSTDHVGFGFIAFIPIR